MSLQRISACCRLHFRRRAAVPKALRSPPNFGCARARFFPLSRHFFRASPLGAGGADAFRGPFVSAHGAGDPSWICGRRGPFRLRPPHQRPLPDLQAPRAAAPSSRSTGSSWRCRRRRFLPLRPQGTGPRCIRKTDTAVPGDLSSSSPPATAWTAPRPRGAPPLQPSSSCPTMQSRRSSPASPPSHSAGSSASPRAGTTSSPSVCVARSFPKPSKGSSDDGYGKGEASGENSPRVLCGNFINTLGRSVPLIDPSFSFLLDQMPCTQSIRLLQSCNGLLLFGHKRISDKYYKLGYIVFNPATEQWLSVPSSGWTPLLHQSEDEDEDEDSEPADYTVTYLIFDPAVSSHFRLVQFGMDCNSDFDSCYTYSSETGVWRTGASEWSDNDGMITVAGSAFFCGMLHLSIIKRPRPFCSGLVTLVTRQDLIVAVDAEGRKCRIMSWPEKCGDAVFLGQSQGHLHYMTEHTDEGHEITELCIWVLQNYDAEEWVLKQNVSFLRLFGRMSCVFCDYRVVAIHPDLNLVFYLQHWDQKLKSYDMDSKEVCTLRTLGLGAHKIAPYIPYFAESSVFANKH